LTFIEAISGALATYAQARRDAKAKKALTHDPFTADTIKRIADDYGYNWRIIRMNGDVIEFTKPIKEAEATMPSW
jgi:hypothetical protein